MTTSTAPLVVTARTWDGGWDLIIDEDNATSTLRLEDAEAQVRDYLDTLEPHVDHSTVHVLVTVEHT